MKKQAPRTTVSKESTDKTLPSYKAFQKVAATARTYGFVPLPQLSISRDDLRTAKAIKPEAHTPAIFSAINTEELITLINAYTQKKFTNLPHPPLLYYESNLPEGSVHGAKTFTLSVLGVQSPLIDTALIHIAHVILQQETGVPYDVAFNSVGDKESISKFNRELAQYYKKHSTDASGELKTLIKKDIFSARVDEATKDEPTQQQAPETLQNLSDMSSAYTKEVLSYLTKLGISPEINPRLIPDRNIANESVFSLKARTPKKDSPYAVGLHYTPLSKKIGTKREVPATLVTLVFPKYKLEKIKTQNQHKAVPSFYFVQVGTDAKLKSLQVVELLRTAKIPVTYALIKDKLVGQLTSAQEAATPYILLMGQRECIENTILVRNTENSSQETVSLDRLIAYLKKLI